MVTAGRAESRNTVLEYVAECRHHGEALSRFRQVALALQLLEKVAGRKDTGLTAQVQSAVTNVQRAMAAVKPAVRKAKEYSFMVVKN